ncbi:helix-turn-helix domain-containing protein [Nonomuraea sp. NPDC005983]|uniref:helix-turn-helix domain-containing protein n=1 Tax=Nonomuraea sp. NPDC005983 TaxID=3155595 RepID=UPI00339F918B
MCAGTHRPNGQSVADRMLFMVAAMAAEMERDLISERTLDGLAAAAAHGRKGGRPPAVTDDVLAAARSRRERGQSITVIARELGVGRSTLYRALENDEPPPPATATPATPAEPVVGGDHKRDQVPAEAFTQAFAGRDLASGSETPADVPEPEVPTASSEPAKPRRSARPKREKKPAATGEDALPWTSDADPIRRRRWYTDDEINAVQVIKTGQGDGACWVIIAGELLGTVQPHRTGTGGRSGWEARHRSGSPASHLGGGIKGSKRPITRDAAVIDLLADVQNAWRNNRERKKRDAALRRLEDGGRP